MIKKVLNQNTKYEQELINSFEPDFSFSDQAINRLNISLNNLSKNNDDKIKIGEDWNLGEWQRCYGLISRLAAKEYMPLRRRRGEIDLLAEYEKIYDRLSENDKTYL